MVKSFAENSTAAAGPDEFDVVELEMQQLALRLGDERDLDPLTVVDRMFGALVNQMATVLGLDATANYLRYGAEMVEREATAVDSHGLSDLAPWGKA